MDERTYAYSSAYTVGGVQISCVDAPAAIDNFFQLARNGTGGFITVTSAHGIVDAQADKNLRSIINNARMTLADGMPVFWIGRLKGAKVSRVCGSDFFSGVMLDPRSRNLRHYFYGGMPESTLLLVNRVKEKLGGGAVAGSHCPGFRKPGAREGNSVLRKIQDAKPDVIWVGLSTPKQEYWMANHTAFFPNSILVGVGAAFDFYAGIQPRAPSLFQRAGLEWLFRLFKEPRRLWPRYRRVVPAMLRILMIEAVGQWSSNRASGCHDVRV
jgi:N-acetylglucosaminyldiphosphoundecaprenol N-acetyl-beta-D-mannosaminyltransferase